MTEPGEHPTTTVWSGSALSLLLHGLLAALPAYDDV